MRNEHDQQKVAELLKSGSADPKVRDRLLSDPISYLRENGIDIPPDIEARVERDRDTVSLSFQQRAGDGELTDQDLDAVAGGDSNTTNKSSASGKPFLTITFNQVFVTSQQISGS